jgi:hypothetical protein
MNMSKVSEEKDPENAISFRSYIFLVSWVIAILLLALIGGCYIMSEFHQYGTHSVKNNQAEAHPSDAELPLYANNISENNSPPVDVRVGFFIDHIVSLSIRDLNWVADFYIWFNWKGNSVNPGENLQIINGIIESKIKQDEIVVGDQHYEQYEVVARITKDFDTELFPYDNHILTIDVEDGTNTSDELHFVADRNNSNISTRVKIPGYNIKGVSMAVTDSAYLTNFGEPSLSKNTVTHYSKIIFGISLFRNGWGLYIKLFLGLFIAVFVSLLALFIKPIFAPPRFGLGVGALFSAVANNYIVSSIIPSNGIMTLSDMVAGLGIAVIFLTMIQSAISLYIYDEKNMQKFSRFFDYASVIVFLIGYIAINVTIALAGNSI